jgi:hypothetical protein
MYSAEKEIHTRADGQQIETSRGMYILGVMDSAYFIQTGNVVTPNSAAILKERIDHLNTMDRKELRHYFKQRVMGENNNPESRGAGVGLIEIARRAAGPIKYDFEPLDSGMQYFTMYITIRQGGKE